MGSLMGFIDEGPVGGYVRLNGQPQAASMAGKRSERYDEAAGLLKSTPSVEGAQTLGTKASCPAYLLGCPWVHRASVCQPGLRMS